MTAQQKQRKGSWTAEEDDRLRQVLQTLPKSEGSCRWSEVASMIPGRSAKQCRERWCYNLDPTIKKTPWTSKEDENLIKAQKELGNKWAQIALQLPGRTENSVKTRHKSILRAKKRAWTNDEDKLILSMHAQIGCRWDQIAERLPLRTKNAVKTRYRMLIRGEISTVCLGSPEQILDSVDLPENPGGNVLPPIPSSLLSTTTTTKKKYKKKSASRFNGMPSPTSVSSISFMDDDFNGAKSNKKKRRASVKLERESKRQMNESHHSYTPVPHAHAPLLPMHDAGSQYPTMDDFDLYPHDDYHFFEPMPSSNQHHQAQAPKQSYSYALPSAPIEPSLFVHPAPASSSQSRSTTSKWNNEEFNLLDDHSSFLDLEDVHSQPQAQVHPYCFSQAPSCASQSAPVQSSYSHSHGGQQAMNNFDVASDAQGQGQGFADIFGFAHVAASMPPPPSNMGVY